MAEHIYERDGDVYRPTLWAGSPWSPDAQHGAPVAGLFMRASEEAAREGGLQPARLTVDLFRPVPKLPLRLARRFVRRGRKLALLELALVHDGEEVARASALLFAPRAELASNWGDAGTPPPPPPERATPFDFMPPWFRESSPPGFHFSLQCRTTRDELGPAAWLTTPLDLVAGEPTTPSVRFAALSDMTFAMGGRLALRLGAVDQRAVQTRFINADITLYRERAPEGDWLAFRPAALSDRAGIGIAEVTQFDRTGRIGRSLQALVANT
jgi:hypothetical protein